MTTFTDTKYRHALPDSGSPNHMVGPAGDSKADARTYFLPEVDDEVMVYSSVEPAAPPFDSSLKVPGLADLRGAGLDVSWDVAEYATFSIPIDGIEVGQFAPGPSEFAQEEPTGDARATQRDGEAGASAVLGTDAAIWHNQTDLEFLLDGPEAVDESVTRPHADGLLLDVIIAPANESAMLHGDFSSYVTNGISGTVSYSSNDANLTGAIDGSGNTLAGSTGTATSNVADTVAFRFEMGGLPALLERPPSNDDYKREVSEFDAVHVSHRFGGDVADANLLETMADDSTNILVAKGGDVLDLADLLIGFDAADDINDFLQTSTAHASTTIQADRDGQANGVAFVDMAALQGVSTDVQGLINDGALIVAE